MNITPAILPHAYQEIIDKIYRINDIAEKVQIDVCDGVFGAEKTWYPNALECPLPQNKIYEFDIMVKDWKPCVEACLLYTPAYIVVHIDEFSKQEISLLVEMLGKTKPKLGLAVSNDKDITYFVDLVRYTQSLYGFDMVYVQVMGITHIGEQAQSFEASVVDRIIAIKKEIGDVLLQVDGGMTPETALQVFKAGAETAVSGSYIFGSENAASSYMLMESIGGEYSQSDRD